MKRPVGWTAVASFGVGLCLGFAACVTFFGARLAWKRARHPLLANHHPRRPPSELSRPKAGP